MNVRHCTSMIPQFPVRPNDMPTVLPSVFFTKIFNRVSVAFSSTKKRIVPGVPVMTSEVVIFRAETVPGFVTWTSAIDVGVLFNTAGRCVRPAPFPETEDTLMAAGSRALFRVPVVISEAWRSVRPAPFPLYVPDA